MAQEHELDVHEWGALTRGAAAPSDWLSLAREAWRAGTRSASDLAERVAEACPPAVLDQIAQVYRDLDTVPTADAALLQELTGRHAAGGVVPAHPVLAALRAEFQAALTARRSALSES